MIKKEDFIESLLDCKDIKYHNFGRNKFGLDCVGLPVFALSKLDYEFLDDLSVYSVVGDGYTLTNILSKNSHKKNIDNLEKGDIIVVKFFKHPQHVLIFLDSCFENDNKKYVIHASSLKKKVVIEDFGLWKDKIIAAYTLKILN